MAPLAAMPAAAAPHACKTRFLTLALFACIAFLVAGTWIALAPISDLAAARYGVSVGAVDQVALIFMYLYVPGSALTLWLVDTAGVRTCLVAASAVNTAAIAARWAALTLPGVSPHGAYAVTVLSQLVAALVQPMSLNLAARLTMDWFPSNERDLATTVATMANVVGQMVFSLVSPQIVRTPAQLGTLMLWQLLPNLAVTAAAAALLQERPPAPPSASAAVQWREREVAAAAAKGNAGSAALATLLHDTRALLANTNFLLLASGFAVGTGTVWALLILEAQFITPCGYSDALAGIAGASLLGVGVLAALVIGSVMEATKAYMELQRGVMAAALLATAGVLGAAVPGDAPRLLLAWCALGCALQPLMPLTLEHAAEMTFPLAADVSTSALLVAANTFSSVLTLTLVPLLARDTCSSVVTPAAGLTLALMVGGLALTWAVRRDYKRSAAERRRASGADPDGGEGEQRGDGEGGAATVLLAHHGGGVDDDEQSDSPLLAGAHAPRYDALS